MSLGFGGEDRGGTYHSAYDTPWYVEHFGDKDSTYGATMAQTAGTLVMRFADADVLPYDFTNLADTIGGYSGELKTLVKQLQRDAAVRQRNISMGVYQLAADPKDPMAIPGPLPSPPDMDFSKLDQAVAALKAAGEKFNSARTTGISASPAKLTAINAELTLAERKFLSAEGLPHARGTRTFFMLRAGIRGME